MSSEEHNWLIGIYTMRDQKFERDAMPIIGSNPKKIIYTMQDALCMPT